MTGRWFFHKTRSQKATKFGLVGTDASLAVYVAPRPKRHLPGQCRLGWSCGVRGGQNIRLGRRHLLVRPPVSAARPSQSVIAELLPSVTVNGENPVAAFERATNSMSSESSEFTVRMSEIRRVCIEGTGVVALERTRSTQTVGGTRVVTLYWAFYTASDRTLHMARIRAVGEAELRTYRTQVADFLRRWTAVASRTALGGSVLAG
jgi:hypothetical protein